MRRTRSALSLVGVAFSIIGCSPAVTTQANTQATSVSENTTKVSAFTVDIENLNVDRISIRDGVFQPDGSRDLVFRATVEGPADALYLCTVDAKGSPQYGFLADTIAGREELPAELGSVVDTGRLTVWIGVVENGRFINREGGTLGTLSAGAHQLKLYVPNVGSLRGGSHLRLYARSPSGTLVKGPVTPY